MKTPDEIYAMLTQNDKKLTQNDKNSIKRTTAIMNGQKYLYNGMKKSEKRVSDHVDNGFKDLKAYVDDKHEETRTLLSRLLGALSLNKYQIIFCIAATIVIGIVSFFILKDLPALREYVWKAEKTAENVLQYKRDYIGDPNWAATVLFSFLYAIGGGGILVLICDFCNGLSAKKKAEAEDEDEE